MDARRVAASGGENFKRARTEDDESGGNKGEKDRQQPYGDVARRSIRRHAYNLV